MPKFVSLRNAVQAISDKMRRFVSPRGDDTERSVGIGVSGGVSFAIRHDIQQVNDSVRARALIYFDSTVSLAMMREVVQSAKIAVEQALSPITRSGELRDSFRYKILAPNRQVVIYSDHPAASAIQEGFSKGGSIEKLMEWMQYKDEYRDLEESKQREIAFLIKRKIERGDLPGPRSTLSRLRPEGERRYDYMTRVTEQVSRDIEIMLEQIAIGASD